MPSVHPFLDVGGPIGFAHRGGASAHPENTERAFRHAVELGFTHLETDVHVTRDGVAIAFHDHVLDRVTDRSGVIAEMDWADVQRARVDGTEEIVRLDALFEMFPTTRINLDPKHDAAVAPMVSAIRHAGAIDRVMVGSFSDRRIADVRRRLGPELAVSAGPRRVVALYAASRGVPLRRQRAAHHGALAAQVPVAAKGLTVVSSRFVDTLHRLGMQVHVWTVNDPAEIHRLLDLGVDGIMTDLPEVLRDVYLERGVWPG